VVYAIISHQPISSFLLFPMAAFVGIRLISRFGTSCFWFCLILICCQSFSPTLKSRPLRRSSARLTTTSSSGVTDSSQLPSRPSMSDGRWFQHEVTITAPSRGCHLITKDIEKAISSDISQLKIGLCNLFIQHTSASLTINENADPDVRR
jgi:hypothetical protein